MTQILTMTAMLLGGLTFFLYGMNILSNGLESMAGGGLEKTMNKVAANDFLGFFLGAGITVAIQSSSAFTVMLVGLVNSGILDFSLYMGAACQSLVYGFVSSKIGWTWVFITIAFFCAIIAVLAAIGSKQSK